MADDREMTEQEWIDPKVRTGKIVGAPFLPAGLGATPAKKKGGLTYVFGQGPAGKGLYSEETKESYDLLLTRLKEKAASDQTASRAIESGQGGCLSFWVPSSKTEAERVEEKKALELSLREKENMIAYIQAKQDARGPYDPASPKAFAKYGGDPEQFNEYSFKTLSGAAWPQLRTGPKTFLVGWSAM